MSTYFISDLHLDAAHPAATRSFYRFLETIAKDADALYILGDLFEFWIGDDDKSELAQQVQTALHTLTDAGVPVYLMRGNRDFLLGKKFALRTGVQLLTDPTVIDLYGRRVLLMHGDLLCTDDVKYQAFRRKVNNHYIQKLLLSLPIKLRLKIAMNARKKSMQYTKQTSLSIQDVNQNAVIRCMKDANVDLLIHGHTHRPATHIFESESQYFERRVLNAWHEYGGGIVAHTAKDLTKFELTLT